MRKGLGFLGLAGALIAASVSPAATRSIVCGQRQEIVDFLAGHYHEGRQTAGLSHSGMLIEIFVSDSGSWTIVMSAPSGVSCIVDAGDTWMRDKTPPPTERGA